MLSQKDPHPFSKEVKRLKIALTWKECDFWLSGESLPNWKTKQSTHYLPYHCPQLWYTYCIERGSESERRESLYWKCCTMQGCCNVESVKFGPFWLYESSMQLGRIAVAAKHAKTKARSSPSLSASPSLTTTLPSLATTFPSLTTTLPSLTTTFPSLATTFPSLASFPAFATFPSLTTVPSLTTAFPTFPASRAPFKSLATWAPFKSLTTWAAFKSLTTCRFPSLTTRRCRRFPAASHRPHRPHRTHVSRARPRPRAWSRPTLPGHGHPTRFDHKTALVQVIMLYQTPPISYHLSISFFPGFWWILCCIRKLRNKRITGSNEN